MVFDYLKPKDGPVLDGFEEKEVVYAKDQPEYIPLRTLISAGPERKVLSRWTLTDKQREAVAKGADVFLELMTFGKPLQPIRMIISDGGSDCLPDDDYLLEEVIQKPASERVSQTA
jgi:hypothetical protein